MEEMECDVEVQIHNVLEKHIFDFVKSSTFGNIVDLYPLLAMVLAFNSDYRKRVKAQHLKAWVPLNPPRRWVPCEPSTLARVGFRNPRVTPGFQPTLEPKCWVPRGTHAWESSAWVPWNPGVGSMEPKRGFAWEPRRGSFEPSAWVPTHAWVRRTQGKQGKEEEGNKKGHCWVRFNLGAGFVWCWVCLLEEEDDGKFVILVGPTFVGWARR
ncbi:hypothetical protein SLEP1_g17265 [Rubroshorea leprosula]|uniref:Uncharacterized protein n=1 Tax=Rubroshorea leprosula TaxID=152421 RepID=A0AAV5J2R9_9ROSI|nr:hypothetical protein SLEP1_g17265 [Rubroshorea leprosula]